MNMALHLQVMKYSSVFLILLFCGADYSRAVNITTTGEPVKLICSLASAGKVWWFLSGGDSFLEIFSCPDVRNNSCSRINSALIPLPGSRNFTVEQNVSTSIMHINSTSPVTDKQIFKCEVAGRDDQIYSVSWINPNEISTTCPVTLPDKPFGTSSALQVTLSCGYKFTEELESNFTLKQIGQNKPVVLRSSQNFHAYLPVDSFMNLDEAYCEIYFPGINVTRRCPYPEVIKNEYIFEGNDIIVECDHGMDNEKWKLYNKSGAEEDIRNRSWSREGGRSLLIQDISKQDEGKVVLCQATLVNDTKYGSIVFAVISNIPGDDSADPKTGGPSPKSGSKHNIYLVLTLLFLSLWVITTIVGGVFYWVITKENKSDTPIVATSSPSGYASGASNGRSNENDTPLSSVGARGRRDPETTNTNNSAHNPAFEPETISIDGNRGNRQSNEGNHLYFTLEKSSPSPKTSTSRQECPGSSFNHPKATHWQGYETVGDPNKGVFCSFDFGEYADVSFQGKVTSDLSEYSEVDATQFRGTAPPGAGEYSEVRRSFRGKERPTLPDRNSLNTIPKGEQVERDEISRLYGKVKK